MQYRTGLQYTNRSSLTASNRLHDVPSKEFGTSEATLQLHHNSQYYPQLRKLRLEQLVCCTSLKDVCRTVRVDYSL